MGLRHFVPTFAAAAALALAAPAHADTPGADYAGSPERAPAGPGTAPPGPDLRPDWQAIPPHAPYAGMEPAVRDAWLAKCRARTEWRGRKRKHRDLAADQCETYLDDYYAYYAAASGSYGYGRGYPAYMAQGCCQAPAYAEPECTETVEYVYEDVPLRPKVRRIPARAKAVPDKRIKVD